MIHSPPVTGTLIFPEGLIIPAAGFCLQHAAVILHLDGFRNKIPDITVGFSDAQADGEGAEFQEQEGSLIVQHAVNVIFLLHTEHLGAAEEFAVFVKIAIALELVVQQPVIHHENVHAVGSRLRPVHVILNALVGRCVKQRISRLCSHIGIEIKIFIRIQLRSMILPGGILGENSVVSVNVVEHHVQISFHIAQEFLIAGGFIGGNQGFVHHAVIVSGGALRIFSVLVPVNSLCKILIGARFQLFNQLLCRLRDLILRKILLRITGNLQSKVSMLFHHIRKGEKHRHHRPAVVRGMETAV